MVLSGAVAPALAWIARLLGDGALPGGLRSSEVTYKSEDGGYHVHLHVVVELPKAIPQAVLADAWFCATDPGIAPLFIMWFVPGAIIPGAFLPMMYFPVDFFVEARLFRGNKRIASAKGTLKMKSVTSFAGALDIKEWGFWKEELGELLTKVVVELAKITNKPPRPGARPSDGSATAPPGGGAAEEQREPAQDQDPGQERSAPTRDLALALTGAPGRMRPAVGT